MICDCHEGDRVRLADGMTGTVVEAHTQNRACRYSVPVKVLRDDQPAGSRPVKYAFPYKIGCPGNSVEVL